MVRYGLYESPLGLITVAKTSKGLVMLDFCDCVEKELVDNNAFTDLFELLDRYFAGEEVEFKVDIDWGFYDKRTQILRELTKLKWGETRTYEEIARNVGSSPRGIGSAISKNNVLIIIPCHRVIAKYDIGGYSRGIDLKLKLLEIEGHKFQKIVSRTGRTRYVLLE
ncbi:methylated-DNA--protein-cysteine methyltransferase [Sulfolobales archaeon HS-7]|nr:methylated-DNA--protein-cysteine methyltransferase [Sulfolobales archaeon HS-7]